ncbi:MAG: acetyl-CoA carboxylase biotin carboxyl carrier protein subunit [Pseudonocardiales bacterium]|nr:acetyl-CoA carboxylase biotin carboxyl carrier protein subunit [Pseudonocardiales bacterium]MBV9729383.1 acetyl-CoA carboxylase biotin carboxyl carrier protein subunit [Pseudonocardiales bacterium]
MVERMVGSDAHLLEEMCNQALRLQNSTGRQLLRVRIRHGESAFEAEWSGLPITEPKGHVVADAGESTASGAPDDNIRVCAPLLGTFYRSPEQGASSFIEKGDLVQKGQQLAIIEAMKLMNAVTAPCSGRILDILVDDASPVEYQQPLLVLEPLVAPRHGTTEFATATV